MRNALPILLCLLFAFTLARAQQTEKFDAAKDKEAFKGYVIHLTPVSGGTFGFIILKDKNAVWAQTTNPFLHSQAGFAHKQDAYKLAEWIAGEHDKNSRAPIQMKPGLAKQLNIADTLRSH